LGPPFGLAPPGAGPVPGSPAPQGAKLGPARRCGVAYGDRRALPLRGPGEVEVEQAEPVADTVVVLDRALCAGCGELAPQT
jgi:hypothetical protein